MATVRFSDKLKDTIRTNARGLFSAQMDSAEVSFSKQLLDGLYDRMFRDYLPHMNAIPSEFFKTVSAFDIHPYRQAASIRYTMNPSRPVPLRDISVAGRFTMNGHYTVPDVYLNIDNPEWHDIREEYTAWRERVQTVAAKRDEFMTMVDKILEAHVTLAPALKVWPALWELLPEETREKHKEVKESRRSRAREELEDVDFGKLTAAVTVSKLRGR